MMKDLAADESMTNLYTQRSFATTDHHQAEVLPPLKKKRGLPGNPDPEAEVVALSPRALLTTHRFICEVCNKGFQRDQNLQLHRRGHNLPWKLKQRAHKEIVKKKVYVCPEPSCVHHDPSRALGDLTGIKKHFFRKHGEKKWKCEKCSKKYAVQSDWKAHSKICGTREYRCDCGNIFSRRDSFITHRAFCDALLEETARRAMMAPNPNPLLSSLSHHITTQHIIRPSSSPVPIKKELLQDPHPLGNNIPAWSGSPTLPHYSPLLPPSSLDHHHQNPSSGIIFQTMRQQLGASSAHMSATALLQKAAQMGVAMGHNNNTNNSTLIKPPSHSQSSLLAGLSSSTDHHPSGSMAAFGDDINKAVCAAASANSFLEDMVVMGHSCCPTSGFDGSCNSSSFDDGLIGMLNGRDTHESQFTRDFLGIKPLMSRSRDFMSMSGLEQQHMSSPSASSSMFQQGQIQPHGPG